jgi:hypothetical protein
MSELLLAAAPPICRFPIAQQLARLAEGAARAGWFGMARTRRFDGCREMALLRFLLKMYWRGITFDAQIRVIGANNLGSAGALIMSGHFYLNLLFLRWLRDQGRRVTLVAADPVKTYTLPGTGELLDVIPADRAVFTRIRQRVDNGRLVLLMPDIPLSGKSVAACTVRSPSGTQEIKTSAFVFAEKAGIPLLFCSTRVSPDYQVFTKIVRPPSQNASAARESFVRFLEAEAAEI